MVAYRGGEQSRGDITITRVLCLRHVAKLFDSELGAAGDSSVEKKALEELAQRYWDQYQEIQQRLADELVEARFSVLPSGLRGKVIALVQAGESA
ncbi:hypothetical protein PROPHIGD57-2_18 [Mycobacterium phage prophiGD57-2]|nr:hypothetical protein PROPHIGD57-2_18 [Mycobacterium phage prophiGD57-2]